MVCRPSWLHRFSSKQCSFPNRLLWTAKGCLCHTEQVIISVVLLPTAFNRENYIPESPSKLPSIHQRGYSFKAIAWSLFLFLWSGNFTLGKWEQEQLPSTTLTLSVLPEAVEHITPPHFGPCHGTVLKISHSGCKQMWHQSSVLSLIQSFQP